MDKQPPVPTTGSRNKSHYRERNDSVLIGSRPLMNYVTGVVMQFTTRNKNVVIIKARGKFIKTAVDVAEVATKRFLKNSVNIHTIQTNSEQFVSREGKQVRVSTMEIVLKKK